MPLASADSRRLAEGLTLVLSVFLSAGTGCSGRPEPDRGDPGATVLGLFDLARRGEPSFEILNEWFEPAPSGATRAKLLDTLEALARLTDPEVVTVDRRVGPGDAFVDLVARLPGGGSAGFSVRLRAAETGHWRVSWLQGPGVEWPPGAGAQGDGLSSSASPASSR